VGMEPDALRLVQKKTGQIFAWLKAYHQARTAIKTRVEDQLWLRWFHDLPDHPAIRLRHYEEASQKSEGVFEEDWFLAVRRPDIQSAPPPPEKIFPWLKKAGKTPRKKFVF